MTAPDASFMRKSFQPPGSLLLVPPNLPSSNNGVVVFSNAGIVNLDKREYPS
jgi:hypothetical protein